MKRLILLAGLTSLALVQLVGAQETEEEIKSEIEQLQIEIEEKQAKIDELKALFPQDEIVEGSKDKPIQANGLELWFEMEIAESVEVNGQDLESKEGKLLAVKIGYKSADETTVTINNEDFRLYLADIQYPQTIYWDTTLEKEAVPPNVELENYIVFDLPTHIAEAKELTFEYEPRENMFMKEEVLFSTNVSDFMDRTAPKDAEDTSEAEAEQVAVYEEDYAPTPAVEPELTQEEIYSSIESAYYNDLPYNGFSPQGSETMPYDYYEDETNWENPVTDVNGGEVYTGSLPYFEGQLSPDEMSELMESYYE